MSSLTQHPTTDQPPTVTIEPARVTDLEPLRRFLLRAYVDTYRTYGLTEEAVSHEEFARHLMSGLASKLCNPTTTVLVARVDGQIVGTLTFVIAARADTCEVRGFYVDVRLHGRGIGSALWNVMEAVLLAERVGTTFLDVADAGLAAQHFYEAHGFSTAWAEVWTDHAWTQEAFEVRYLKMFRTVS